MATVQAGPVTINCRFEGRRTVPGRFKVQSTYSWYQILVVISQEIFAVGPKLSQSKMHKLLMILEGGRRGSLRHCLLSRTNRLLLLAAVLRSE